MADTRKETAQILNKLFEYLKNKDQAHLPQFFEYFLLETGYNPKTAKRQVERWVKHNMLKGAIEGEWYLSNNYLERQTTKIPQNIQEEQGILKTEGN